MNKQIPEEVKAGMALLDEKAPGWRDKIHPQQLNMSFCFTCILGQVFGEYHHGLKQLGIAESDEVEVNEEIDEQAKQLGFQSKVRGSNGWRDYDYLTQAWKEALSQTSGPVAAD